MIKLSQLLMSEADSLRSIDEQIKRFAADQEAGKGKRPACVKKVSAKFAKAITS
jgi:hypothetical protein